MNKWILILLAGGLLGAAETSEADVVVIVNQAAELPAKEQVSDVYLGRSRAFTPIDRNETSALRAEFYRKVTGRDAAQIKMVWARLVFTGRGLPPKELRSADAVKKAVAADPSAIGYIEKADLDASVKAALILD